MLIYIRKYIYEYLNLILKKFSEHVLKKSLLYTQYIIQAFEKMFHTFSYVLSLQVYYVHLFLSIVLLVLLGHLFLEIEILWNRAQQQILLIYSVSGYENGFSAGHTKQLSTVLNVCQYCILYLFLCSFFCVYYVHVFFLLFFWFFCEIPKRVFS